MNLTVQTATLATSLLAAMLLKAGSANPPSTADTQRASEAWAASLAAESSGNHEEALKHTAAWKQAGGDLYMATLRSAWLHCQKQDYPKAALLYSQAAAQQPAAITPLLGLLTAAQGMNESAKIIAAAERVLRVEPSHYRALMAAAGGHYAAGDYRRARSAYARALASYPEDNDALSGLSWSALYLGDKREAQRGFERIAMTAPAYPWVQDGLAICAR